MLPLVEHLVEAVHGEQRDPGHVQLRDDLVGHGGLAAGRAAADPDDEGLDLLALAVVPGRPALRVDGALGRADDGLPLRADGRVGGQRPLPLMRLMQLSKISIKIFATNLSPPGVGRCGRQRQRALQHARPRPAQAAVRPPRGVEGGEVEGGGRGGAGRGGRGQQVRLLGQDVVLAEQRVRALVTALLLRQLLRNTRGGDGLLPRGAQGTHHLDPEGLEQVRGRHLRHLRHLACHHWEHGATAR